MGGDFNCLLNEKLDKSGGKDVDKLKVVDKISDVMDSIDLIDVWRFQHPDACVWYLHFWGIVGKFWSMF